MTVYPRASPFSQPHQLYPDLETSGSPAATQHAADLEAVVSRLWTLTTPSSANIHPLYQQNVLGREIVVTEDPRLHLLWINNRIFIKPLPPYLLSHSFWTHVFPPQPSLLTAQLPVRRAAIGFLRTYRYLIQYESDLWIAQQEHLRLVPIKLNWTEMSTFLADLESIEDRDASARYQYGELRLSRLNLYAPLLFGRLSYEHIPMQYGEYFARLYGPILFIFAVVTTILNAMQVALAADPGRPSSSYLWQIFYWFATMILVTTVMVGCSLVALWLGMIANEWRFSLRNRHKAQE
ncbi:hypothetical protein AYO21_10531 [Fonsecaea monophora]|uniref:Uncharacterized protein n=1 Tax=Fonsecaea monophora TaxID=254056 RepID=A0A177EVD6_9EURO|nr:hypothetical protein AYO21_10531 [Fonsecaea monophora]OAG35260.1 hypothetical protein AYO21_10531 [Fonsecaea monophora]